MVFLYNCGIYSLRFLYWAASWFSSKAGAFRKGRREQIEKLKKPFPLHESETLVWFHCASLGEFEQGRPVMEALKTWRPSVKILLTFFSPSGYEVRKNYDYADFIFYLPWDTPQNARWFAGTVRPRLVVFVKYEFWYHYSTELFKRNIPLISISSIFRPGQIFFKGYGQLFSSILKRFNHFFVQNQESVELLQAIGIASVTVVGDTRFDRVFEITRKNGEFPIALRFKDGRKLMVIGSAWPEDMQVLFPFINENKGRLKFIIAPHEITETFLLAIEKSVEGESIRYSEVNDQAVEKASVLLIDNVGMLSGLYRYGEFAFVGGAFGQGLHNILEAACFGVPIFFGNKAYEKFQEAVDLVFRGGAFGIETYAELKSKYEWMTQHPETYQLACSVTHQYVLDNLGATEKIMAHCKKFLS